MPRTLIPAAPQGQPMSGTEPSDAALARRAAERGAERARERFRTDLAVETKRSPTDVVTDADRAVQQRIVETIETHRPADAIVAEEAGQRSELPVADRAWVVDPIDGTGNFVRGSPLWTTSVTVVDDREPLATANIVPVTDDTYLADGDRASWNGTPMAVSNRTDPESAAIAAMMGWRGGPSGVGEICQGIRERFGELHRFRTGHTTMSMVASGQLDGGITFSQGAPWDRIAGIHLIAAAGGRATDLDGEPWTLDADGLVVSNGHIHATLLETATRIRERLER